MVLLATTANYTQIRVQLCYVRAAEVFARVKACETYMYNNGGILET